MSEARHLFEEHCADRAQQEVFDFLRLPTDKAFAELADLVGEEGLQEFVTDALFVAAGLTPKGESEPCSPEDVPELATDLLRLLIEQREARLLTSDDSD